MIKFGIPDNYVEIQFLHLLLGYRCHCSVCLILSTSAYFGSCLQLLLFGITTETVI